ncbi:L-aspartate oxidase [Commensalibacter melissae]|uniref:L-aspartate oxidase n=1 Tax=Commensalibacter melissae TaxID=2070537 RepID=UPI0012D99F4D|nr:L-aspartate oxidase [Commensalibacter melissae]MUG08545.1 L-aspartate oxidase [Commensalibacter melissae]
MKNIMQSPVVVIGSGLAGLMTALQLAPLPVLLLTQGKIGQETSSIYAQGGIAAASHEEKDSSAHIEDTLRAGAGLCDQKAVATILDDGRKAIEVLEKYGVIFDHDRHGRPRLGLEGAHSHRRIFHIDGDASGRGIIKVLTEAVLRTPSITVMENTIAVRLLKDKNKIRGVITQIEGQFRSIVTSTIVLATGGIGGLFEESTNPLQNYGQGLILAADIGAVLADLEFIQFHPTALDANIFPKTLISEAVRGEGAVLVNSDNQRFLANTEGQELASRDVVARAIYHQTIQGKKVYLDARKALGKDFETRFPTIAQLCRQVGIDPSMDLIPVKPVEHFHMGGIMTNLNGETTVKGLWAVGEVASTGLHGANRLASNSLLEATVMAMRAAKAILDSYPSIQSNDNEIDETGIVISDRLPFVKKIMQKDLNIIRDEDTLRSAIRQFLTLVNEHDDKYVLNPEQIALMIAVSAFLRKESRGAHYRQDYPVTLEKANRSFISFDQAYQYAKTL